jgi:Secretion system C-terminal sorting domain
MRKKILSVAFFLAISANFVFAQDITMTVAQISHSTTDPDGAGPATGSVELEFRLSVSAGTVLADGMAFLFVYQSAALMHTPTNTTVPVGPLASAVGWTQNVDNRPGNIVSVSYGGRNFDRRMIIAFAQGSAIPNMPVTTTPTGIARVTYWTLGASYPHGGYIVVEDGGLVPQNSLSSDGGGTEYPYLSANLAQPLGTGTLPVTFSNYDVKCTDKGAILTWATSTEQNSDKFEIQRSTNGTDWTTIGAVPAAGNSNSSRSYQYLDLNSGVAVYRIRQVDLDGRFIYTATRQTNCKASQFDVVLYPVPAKDNLSVVIRSDKSVRTDLQIVDMKGTVLRRIPTQINNGNTNINIVVTELPAGQYLLRSADPAITINKKFTIIR